MKKKKPKRKRKPGSGKRIGGAYEREISTLLSEWWTHNKRTDIFWRTSTSGGRATRRRKVGKQTKGQHSDIGATDPIGFPLTQVAVIETKKGYSHTSIQDAFDNVPRGGKPEKASMFGEWVHQAIAGHRADNTFSWIIISRRSSRNSMIFIGRNLYDALRKNKTGIEKLVRRVHIVTWVPSVHRKNKKTKKMELAFGSKHVECVGFPLDQFLKRITRKHIEQLAKQWRRAKREQ